MRTIHNQLEKLEAARSAFLLLLLVTFGYLSLSLVNTFPGLTEPYWALLGLTDPYLA